MTRARVVEMVVEQGLGKIDLEDDRRVMPFDVSVSRSGVPKVGAQVEVTLGPSRLGGLKVVSLEVLPTWEPTAPMPCVVLRLTGGQAELMYLDGQLVWASLPCHADNAASTGDTGLLVAERKSGSDSFTETRPSKWWPAPIEAAAKAQILRGFRKYLEGEWEHWENPDTRHNASLKQELRANLFAGADLGIDVEQWLTIADYPTDPEEDDAREGIPPSIRLTRSA